MALKLGRGGDAPPFMVMDVITRANELARRIPPGSPQVLRLEVGQPGTGAPAGARAAAMAALGAGEPLGYTEALGRRSLREAIARHYLHWYNLPVSADRIAITCGASAAFPLAFLASFDPGDRIALGAPYYPPYVNTLTALGMRPVVIPTSAASRFQLTVAELDALRPVPDGVIIASPGNPAGTMMKPDELEAITAWCTTRGVRLISDEIYHGIQYGVPISSAAASADAVVVNSFSKYFSMTGWRVGWMVLPENLVRPVERLAQNMMISAPHIAQIAAEAALLCHDELQANVLRYRRSRDRLLAALPSRWFAEAGAPDGAFYLYGDLGPDGDSPELCRRLLADCRVACSPGADFDAARGRCTLRLSYAGDEAMVEEAATRLAAWL